MPDLRPLAALVDGVVHERVVVVGSSPQDASDLDLLVRPAAAAEVEQRLPGMGFAPWRGGWMRLSGGIAEVVDVAPASTWRLPDDEVDAVFAEGEPVDGLSRVVEPSPRHALLLLGRRVSANEGRIDHRRLARARRALLADPDALLAARRHARAWGCTGGLAVLEALLAGGEPSRREVREHLRADGVRLPGPLRSAARRLRPPRERRGVVAVCGLDGAGKTTQAVALVGSLRSLGYDATTVWARISYGQALVWLAAPVKAALRLRPRREGSAAPERPPADPPPSAVGHPASRPSVVSVWSAVVALLYAVTARTLVGRHLRRGRIVVTDRYVLDSVVHLHDRYGAETPLGLQTRLVVRLLPRPVATFFLDVPAEEAYRRKPEQFSVDRLSQQRALYLEQAGRLGAVVVDGTLPAADVAERLVRDVLHALA